MAGHGRGGGDLDAPWRVHPEDEDEATDDRGDYGNAAQPAATAAVVCSCAGRLHRMAREPVPGDPVSDGEVKGVLVREPSVRLDRDGVIRELRQMADDVESGHVAAFRMELEITGVGNMHRVTVQGAHPLAPTFDTSDGEPTPATPSGRGPK